MSAQSYSCIENHSDACKIRAEARSGVTTVPAWWGSFALLCILGSASSALAQRPDDFRRTFVMAEDSLLVRPGLDADAFRAYLAMTEDDEGTEARQ